MLSVDAATLPRTARHSSNAGEYASHTYGTFHGSSVYAEALFSAFEARFIIVSNTYYNASNEITFNGVEDTPCGVHGPNGNMGVDGTVKPSDNQGCYTTAGAERQIEVIDAIRNEGNVAAINFSAGSTLPFLDSTSCSRNNNLFAILKRENIAFIAAAGNGGPDDPVNSPACNTNVIAVGALNRDGTPASYTSSGTNQIDFYADGSAVRGGEGTSFASPKVAGAFAVVQSAEARVRTVDEIKRALTASALSFVVVNGRSIPVVTNVSAQAAAACLIDGSCVVTVPEGLEELGYEDGGIFGNIFNGEDTKYDLELDFRLVTPPSSQNIIEGSTQAETLSRAFQTIGDSVPSERDVVLKFEGRSQGFIVIDVLINGVRRFSTRSFVNSRNAEFIIPRTMFNAGPNTITLQPRSSSSIWGVTNISAEFTPVVPLALNLPDRNRYGSNQNPNRPTGMRASFELSSVDSDVTLTATGLGVNSPDEIEVYINGRFQGSLDNGAATTVGAEPNFFTVAKEELQVGFNVIEFVQKVGALADWSVSDILVAVDTGRPTLQLGQINTTEYGNNFGTNENPLQLEADFIPRSQSDHKISWKAFDIERTGDLEVLLNGTPLKIANTTGNARFGAPETLTLASRLFSSGVNTLTFRTKVGAFDTTWGVTDLSISPSDVINLESSSSLNKTYGYYPLYTGGVPAGWTRTYSQEEYQTRLNAQFDNTEDVDRTLTIIGWDIDSPQEVAVYLNGTFLQYLQSVAVSSIFSPPNKITLSKDSLLQGINTISLRTKDDVFTGFQSEKWGAKFTRFTSPSSDSAALMPVIMLLLDDDPI